MSSPRTGFGYLDAVLDQPGSVLAFAHRGGAYHPQIEGLENTLAAFRHAVALGYDYLETDVHATRDGVLLAFHDAVLDRVTDRRGEIADLRHDEVRAAVIGGREQIPTLEQLFDELPGARFNIDLKSDGAVAPLAALLDAREAWDRVLVGSFSGRRLAEFGRLVSRPVPTSATPLDVCGSWPCPAPGSPAGSAAGGSRRSRCPTASAACSSPVPGWSAGPTPPASTCTCGPSTTRRRCTRCSTSGWTGSSRIAPTCSRMCSSLGDSGGAGSTGPRRETT